MKPIGVVPHTGKDEAIALARQVIRALEGVGAEPVLEPEAAAVLGEPERGRELSAWQGVEAAVVLGGDGALLKTARALAPHGIPILGVNLGHFGFLSEVEGSAADEAVRRLAAGDYDVESRMMLDVRVRRRGRDMASYLALNDAVVSRGTFARILHIATRSGDEEVLRFLGDGVIVATPTGSTAYSLSAGGPIINPLLECLVLTPICPHALATRSVVLTPDEDVEVEVSAAHEDIMLTIDGQEGFKLRPGDTVAITRSVHRTRLVRLGRHSFYEVLRTRMGQRPM